MRGVGCGRQRGGHDEPGMAPEPAHHGEAHRGELLAIQWLPNRNGQNNVCVSSPEARLDLGYTWIGGTT